MSGTASVVLLIEPNDTSRSVYADALHNAGFIVVGARDCAAALYALTEIIPQIIIASFDLRTHDECLAFCERLKSNSRTRAIPILLTSETITIEDLRRATDISVLGLSIAQQDGAKMISAVRAVLAVAEGQAAISQPQHNSGRFA